jgi:DNA-directed RNA polymerase subunit RPC12/RpoP
MGLAWYCGACKRKLGLDLDEAIRRWGRSQVFIKWSPPVKCSGCGSRDITMIVQAKVPGR